MGTQKLTKKQRRDLYLKLAKLESLALNACAKYLKYKYPYPENPVALQLRKMLPELDMINPPNNNFNSQGENIIALLFCYQMCK